MAELMYWITLDCTIVLNEVGIIFVCVIYIRNCDFYIHKIVFRRKIKTKVELHITVMLICVIDINNQGQWANCTGHALVSN